MGLQRGGRAVLSLDAGHVAELVAELAPLVEGARVAACVAALPRDVVLLLEREGTDGVERLRLRLASDPDAPRLHLQRARQARPQGPLGPFFRTLEEELVGARVRRLEQLGRDRAVALHCDESPSGERRALVLELFGRRANLVLCGPAERVLDVLVPPSPKARNPRLVVGQPWQPPAGPPQELPPGARLAAALEPAPEPGAELTADPRAPLSWLVETRLGAQAENASRERDASDLRDRLRRRRGRARALVEGLERRAAAARDAERVRQDGELLKLALGRLRRGLERIEVADVFADGAARVLELDPRRSPQENVERTFERYRKLLRAQASVEAELGLARSRAAEIEALLGALEAPDADPATLERRALDAGVLEPRQEPDVRKRPTPKPRKPYRSFRGSHGGEIRVGRSARDNDELTLRHCRGNDLWLHTADAPGSHVVLRLARGAEPDPEELLDAAHLAAHFSPLREARRVQVHVARRKQVHKPRGAKPGLVQLSGGRVLALRVQPERLRRLLQGDRAHHGEDPA